MCVSFAAIAVWASMASIGATADPPPPYSESRTFISFVPNVEDLEILPDPDYEFWSIRPKDSNASFSTETGLTFNIWTGEDGFRLGTNPDVYERPFPSVGQRLVGSGLTTLSQGEKITVVIEGLPEGPHALHTWHSYYSPTSESSNVEIIMDNIIESAVCSQTKNSPAVYLGMHEYFC